MTGGERVAGGERAEVHVASDDDDWMRAGAEAIVEALLDAQRAGRVATLALPGGSTPAPVLRALSGALGAAVDWARVEVFLGDERCVPRDHADSNAALIRRELLAGFGERAPRLHEVEGAAERPGRARDVDGVDGGNGADGAHGATTAPPPAEYAYEALLPERLDLVVGGLGPDGHTASLFPGVDNDGPERVRYVHDCPKPPPDRITLTPRALREARARLMLVRGADKAPAVRRALEGAWDPIETPAQWMRAGTWILDAAAAADWNANRASGAPDEETRDD